MLIVFGINLLLFSIDWLVNIKVFNETYLVYSWIQMSWMYKELYQSYDAYTRIIISNYVFDLS